jgi:hypothetical protein
MLFFTVGPFSDNLQDIKVCHVEQHVRQWQLFVLWVMISYVDLVTSPETQKWRKLYKKMVLYVRMTNTEIEYNQGRRTGPNTYLWTCKIMPLNSNQYRPI